MGIEKEKISSSQLTFLLAGFVMSSALTVAFIQSVTKQNTWQVIVSGTALAFVWTWMYLKLVQMYPGKNMVEIHELVYGSRLGKVICGINIIWFMLLTPQHLRHVGDFFLAYFMPETPMVAIVIPFTLLCVWTSRKGLEVIARVSVILVIITTIVNILIFALLLKDIKLTNFLPLFELSWRDFIQGTNIVYSIPYSDLLALMVIIPSLNKLKEAKKAVYLGMTVGAGTILFVTVQYIAVLGVTATIMTAPFLEAVRLINVAKIFTRLEVLVAIMLLNLVFMKVSILLYVTELSLAHLFRLRTYLPMGFPVGIICISLSILFFNSTMEQGYWGTNIWPIFALPFLVLHPVLSLLIAKIRTRKRKKRTA